MYLGDIEPTDTSGVTEHRIAGQFGPHSTSAYWEGWEPVIGHVFLFI